MLDALVVAALRRHAVEHDTMPCEPALADTAAFCAHYGVDPADSANTILVSSKRPVGVTAACVVLATTRLDVNKKVCSELGVKKASFASAETTTRLTGMEIGGVTPFGLPDGMPILVDRAVMARPSIVLGGGNRTSKLRISPDALLGVPGIRVVDQLAIPADA